MSHGRHRLFDAKRREWHVYMRGATLGGRWKGNVRIGPNAALTAILITDVITSSAGNGTVTITGGPAHWEPLGVSENLEDWHGKAQVGN